MRILFSYEGLHYEVDEGAAYSNWLVLPEGTVLEVTNGWLESLPPQPSGLQAVDNFLTGTPEEKALKLQTVVARQVS